MLLPTLDNTIGAAFIGTICAAVLYGATNIQVYMYYSTYQNDRLVHKLAVALLWILDTIHLSLTVAATYHYLITSFGRLAELHVVTWAFKLQIAINVIIVLIVQTLYAARVWRLGRHRRRILPVLVLIVLAGVYAIGFALIVKAYTLDRFDETPRVSWVIYSSFVSTTFSDFVIAGVMCFYLMNSKSGFSSTNNKIVAIIKMTLTTGCLTSACSLACLITFATMPNNLVYLGIEFLLTKLYINSFLAMLNARQSVCNKDTSTGHSVSLGKFNVRATGTSSHGATDADNAIPLSPLSVTVYSGQVRGEKLQQVVDHNIYPVRDYNSDDTGVGDKIHSPV